MEFLKILEAIIHYGPHIIAIASAISAITPVPDQTNRVLSTLNSIISVLALNVGQAKKTKNQTPPANPQ